MTERQSRFTITRRSALKAAALGLVASPAILRVTNAQGLEKVKAALPWLPEGAYAYSFIAKAQGYWRTRGLDVDLARGSGALAAAQAISQGQFDLGLSTAGALVLLADKGIDLRSIAIADYEPTMAIAVLGDSPIKQPKDLEGRKVGQTLASTDAPFFAPFCKVNGVDIAKVRLLNMDARVRNQSLVEGRVDAITGLASSMLAAIGGSGKSVRFLLYSDYGVFLYGNVAAMVRPETLEKRPEFCQAFCDGLLEGLKFSLVHPDEAQRIFLDAVPELKMTATAAEFARLGMGVQRFSVMAVPDGREHGLGWADLGKLDRMADFVMRYQAEPGATKPDIATLFTNRFIGPVRLSDAEWATARQETEWVAKLLRKPA